MGRVDKRGPIIDRHRENFQDLVNTTRARYWSMIHELAEQTGQAPEYEAGLLMRRAFVQARRGNEAPIRGRYLCIASIWEAPLSAAQGDPEHYVWRNGNVSMTEWARDDPYTGERVQGWAGVAGLVGRLIDESCGDENLPPGLSDKALYNRFVKIRSNLYKYGVAGANVHFETRRARFWARIRVWRDVSD